MAAITFSGFNNIDFKQVVSAIIAQERQPLATLQNQQTSLDKQKSAFGTLATKLTALEDALGALAADSGVQAVTAASSDTGVGVTATGAAVEGTYEIAVTAMARRQVTASSTTYSSASEVIATGGALTLTGADGTVATISVEPLMTVKELVDAINAANAPVSASLVQSTPGQYQIVLTGRRSGAANTFSVSSTLSGGKGLAVPATNAQNASDAVFTVNGVPVRSATNTVEDVVPGVSLTIARDDAEASVTVSRDMAAPRERVQKLMTAYNDLVAFLNEQRTAAAGGQASIGRDPLVRQLQNSLRSALLGQYPGAGTYRRLAEVGVGFDRTGKMELDAKTFETAITSRPVDVAALFSGSGGNGGAFGAISSLVETYTRSGGLVADVRDRLSTQVRSLANRIAAFESQLEQRRMTLQKEFQAADEAMSQLNSQINSLSSLNGQFRLF